MDFPLLIQLGTEDLNRGHTYELTPGDTCLLLASNQMSRDDGGEVCSS
jgi:hypothetical protein